MLRRFLQRASAPNLPLGRYRVTVQMEGFSTATSEAVEISSQANVRVDIRLQPGSITDTVQVNSQPDLLDTATATVSASASTKELHELPFISFGQKADIANYLQYLPGAENTPARTGVRWGAPVTSLAASNFGMITSSGPGRRVQLSLEIQF